MFSELASGIGGAAIILGILFFVVWIVENHKDNSQHNKDVERQNREMREKFPSVFADKPKAQP
jgi:hypothetical protein